MANTRKSRQRAKLAGYRNDVASYQEERHAMILAQTADNYYRGLSMNPLMRGTATVGTLGETATQGHGFASHWSESDDVARARRETRAINAGYWYGATCRIVWQGDAIVERYRPTRADLSFPSQRYDREQAQAARQAGTRQAINTRKRNALARQEYELRKSRERNDSLALRGKLVHNER